MHWLTLTVLVPLLRPLGCDASGVATVVLARDNNTHESLFQSRQLFYNNYHGGGSTSNGYSDGFMNNLKGSFSSLASMFSAKSSYGGSSGGSYGGSGQQCCGSSYSKDNQQILPGLALAALSFLLLYLIFQARNANNGRRRKRTANRQPRSSEEVMLDGSTWLSLIHEMWEQDGVVDDPSCAQHTLCRMNYLAMAAPGQAGWAVSLSSMPLSYLLHNRHNGGFSMYMDAALLGRAGANCTSLFSSCPRLH